MATKNVQLKDLNGNILNPKSLASLIINNDGYDLGGVEANAQVNKIEVIKVNGVNLPIEGKTVSITETPYTIQRAADAEEGMAATYQLLKDGTPIGDKINIPKDMVVSEGSLKVCEVANAPVAGLAVGDPYIELTLANNDGTKIYIPVKGLVDIYTAGAGLKVENNEFSLDLTDADIIGGLGDDYNEEDADKLATVGDVQAELDKKVDANTAITGATKCKITYDAKGLVTKGEDLEAADIPLLDSVKVSTLGSYAKAGVFEAIKTTDSLNDALGKLEKGLDTKQDNITGAATSIVSDDLTANMILASDAQGKVAATTIPSSTLFITFEEVV